MKAITSVARELVRVASGLVIREHGREREKEKRSAVIYTVDSRWSRPVNEVKFVALVQPFHFDRTFLHVLNNNVKMLWSARLEEKKKKKKNSDLIFDTLKFPRY